MTKTTLSKADGRLILDPKVALTIPKHGLTTYN